MYKLLAAVLSVFMYSVFQTSERKNIPRSQQALEIEVQFEKKTLCIVRNVMIFMQMFRGVIKHYCDTAKTMVNVLTWLQFQVSNICY